MENTDDNSKSPKSALVSELSGFSEEENSTSSKSPRSSSNSSTPRSKNVKSKFQRPKGKWTPPGKSSDFILKDDYAKASETATKIRQKTGLITDDFFLKHKCEWDQNYPENPERLASILRRLNELNLEDYLLRLPYENKNLSYFESKHSKEIIQKLQYINNLKDMNKVEQEATQYDAVYFNKFTYEAAIKSASSVNQLVKEVCKQEKITNGIALTRPPGHHAMESEFCGYCYFNNVALAAQDMLDSNLAQKILIVDFDVHHGQATQRMFYDDKRVLYFSIHRYEHGEFWPNLRESNFDYIGEKEGKGYNINFPLNVTGLDDNDYLAVVFNILLPAAYEFQPDLVLISAGYDASIGCFEGRMLVSPAFYGHLIKLLSGLAQGKIAVCLEGGYFPPSLSEGVARTLMALLDFPCDKMKPLKPPHPAVAEIINNLRYFLRPYWNCFNTEFSSSDNLHIAKVLYRGEPDKPPYLTRDCYPKNSDEEVMKFTKMIESFKAENPVVFKRGICYAYDDCMLLHSSAGPETPYRLKILMEKFVQDFCLDKRCTKVDGLPVTKEMLQVVHTDKYVSCLLEGTFMYDKTRTDIFVDDNTQKAALTSVSSLYGVAEEVMNGKYDAGVAFIRPPGHHAEKEEAGGFCFINNVGVIASHIAEKYKARVLILDWDIHHGNGTQHMFYDNKNVMYMSIHKFENGTFFPNGLDADYQFVGEGDAAGFNVNIPLNESRMRNEDYIMIFNTLILPIAYSFAPDVIFISAGFDAGINDLLGNYLLMPEVFGHFTQLLKSLAQGKLIVALEGGYNPSTVAYSMLMCVKALLGDPLPSLDDFKSPHKSLETTIKNVIGVQKKYWNVLEVVKNLPNN